MNFSCTIHSYINDQAASTIFNNAPLTVVKRNETKQRFGDARDARKTEGSSGKKKNKRTGEKILVMVADRGTVNLDFKGLSGIKDI